MKKLLFSLFQTPSGANSSQRSVEGDALLPGGPGFQTPSGANSSQLPGVRRSSSWSGVSNPFRG